MSFQYSRGMIIFVAQPTIILVAVSTHLNKRKKSNCHLKQVRQLSGLAYIPTCRSPSPQL